MTTLPLFAIYFTLTNRVAASSNEMGEYFGSRGLPPRPQQNNTSHLVLQTNCSSSRLLINSPVSVTSYAKPILTANTYHAAFQYGGLHSVDEVSQADYTACSTSNTLSSSSDGNTVVTLSQPGTRYFVCGTSGHCGQGMKVAIPVSAASTTPGGSPTPTTPSTPSTPTGQSPPPSAAGAFRPPVQALLAGAFLAALALLG